MAEAAPVALAAAANPQHPQRCAQVNADAPFRRQVQDAGMRTPLSFCSTGDACNFALELPCRSGSSTMKAELGKSESRSKIAPSGQRVTARRTFTMTAGSSLAGVRRAA
jgi:hypothetical protein